MLQELQDKCGYVLLHVGGDWGPSLEGPTALTSEKAQSSVGVVIYDLFGPMPTSDAAALDGHIGVIQGRCSVKDVGELLEADHSDVGDELAQLVYTQTCGIPALVLAAAELLRNQGVRGAYKQVLKPNNRLLRDMKRLVTTSARKSVASMDMSTRQALLECLTGGRKPGQGKELKAEELLLLASGWLWPAVDGTHVTVTEGFVGYWLRTEVLLPMQRQDPGALPEFTAGELPSLRKPTLQERYLSALRGYAAAQKHPRQVSPRQTFDAHGYSDRRLNRWPFVPVDNYEDDSFTLGPILRPGAYHSGETPGYGAAFERRMDQLDRELLPELDHYDCSPFGSATFGNGSPYS